MMGTKHSSGDQRDQFVHPRMGRLLSLGHGETRFRVTGSMDSPAPAQDIVGAMEETEDPVSKVSSLGTRGTACAQGHRDRAWCLVECGSLTHAFGREQSFTHGVGSPQPSYSTPGPAAEHLNRRIRTRTYGGVGGRERQLSLRPDPEETKPFGWAASFRWEKAAINTQITRSPRTQAVTRTCSQAPTVASLNCVLQSRPSHPI